MTTKKFEEMFPSLAHAEAFTVGGRRFVSMDKVLEIIDRLDAEAIEDFELDTNYGLAVVHDRFEKARKKIKAFKGGEQE